MSAWTDHSAAPWTAPSPSSWTLQWEKLSASATRLCAPEKLRCVPCFIPLATRQTCKYGMNNHKADRRPLQSAICVSKLAPNQNKVFFGILTRGSLDIAQHNTLGSFEGVSHQNRSSTMGRKLIKKKKKTDAIDIQAFMLAWIFKILS